MSSFPFINGIVRVDSGNVCGTGFVVRDNLVLTSAHNLESFSDIRLTFPDSRGLFNKEVSGQIFSLFGNDTGDIAAVRFTEDVGDHIQPIKLLTSDFSKDHAFEAYGFPQSSQVNGMPVQGEIKFVGSYNNFGIPQLQLACSALTSGFSGAPIIDTELQAAVGIACDIIAPDQHLRGIDTCHAVTADYIGERIPEIMLNNLDLRGRTYNRFLELNIGEMIEVKLKEERAYGFLINYDGIRGLLHYNNVSARDREKISEMEVGNTLLVELIEKKTDEFGDFYLGVAFGKKASDVKLKADNGMVIETFRRSIGGEVDLSNRMLSSLPAEIGDFQHVTSLNLRSNKLSSLPPELFELVELEFLDISFNNFKELPGDLFSKLPKLHSLHAHNNKISFLPQSASQTESIQEISLYNNPVINLPKSLHGQESIDLQAHKGELITDAEDEFIMLGDKKMIGVYLENNSGGKTAKIVAMSEFGLVHGIAHRKLYGDRRDRILQSGTIRTFTLTGKKSSGCYTFEDQLEGGRFSTNSPLLTSNYRRNKNAIPLKSLPMYEPLISTARLAYNYGIFFRFNDSEGRYRDGLLHKSEIPSELWEKSGKGQLLIGMQAHVKIVDINLDVCSPNGGAVLQITPQFEEESQKFMNKTSN